MSDPVERIIFIGGGFSTLLTLRHYVQNYQLSGRTDPVHITIIEPVNPFGRGIAYGLPDRSNFLLNSPGRAMAVADGDNEFLVWLERNEATWKSFLQNNPLLDSWNQSNKAWLENKDYAPIYMPRSVFGLFLQDMGKNTFEAIQALSSIDIETIQSMARSVERQADGNWGVQTTDQSIQAEKIVLSIGSLASRNFSGLEGCSGYFHDMYAAGIEAVKAEILRRRGNGKVKILLAGTNAAFMDFIHFVANDTDVRSAVTLTGVSNSGGLPHGGITQSKPQAYQLHHLPALLEQPDLTVDDILKALCAEIKTAKQRGYMKSQEGHARIDMSVRAALHTIRPDLTNRLSFDEKVKFAAAGGARYEAIMRRTAIESSKEAEQLCDDGVLQLRAAKIEDIRPDQDQVTVILRDINGVKSETADMVLNCLGSATLSDCEMPLLQNLQTGQTIIENVSGRGVLVNDHFEAADNFFVIGPLLSGGITPAGEILHHLEDVRQIGRYAAKLATIISKL